jgi:hypothetical protein
MSDHRRKSLASGWGKEKSDNEGTHEVTRMRRGLPRVVGEGCLVDAFW